MNYMVYKIYYVILLINMLLNVLIELYYKWIIIFWELYIIFKIINQYEIT